MMQVTLEVRDGADVQEVPYAPTDGELERALSRLNGIDATIVTLELGDKKLFVGGGPDVFNVVLWLEDDLIYDLVGDASVPGERNLVMGGQLTPVPLRHCVSFDRAKAAALEFIRTGSVRISPAWENQH